MSGPSTDRLLEMERRVEREPASLLFAPLAEMYRSAGRLADAERVLRIGLQRHPEHHSAATALGRVLLEQGRLDEAGSVLEGVVALVPDNLLAVRLLREVVAARSSRPSPPRRATSATETHSPASRAGSPEVQPLPAPRDRLVSGTLADLYLNQGDQEQGIAILRELARREPENSAWRERLRSAERAAAPSLPQPAPAFGGRIVPEPLPEEVWEESGTDESDDDPSTLNLFGGKRVIAARPALPPEQAAPGVPRSAATSPAAEEAETLTPGSIPGSLQRLRGYLARIEQYRTARAL